MKTLNTVLNPMLMVIAVILAGGVASRADEISSALIIAVAPNLSQADKKMTLTELSYVLKDCVTNAPVGRHIEIWNAFTGTPVATLEVPEGSAKTREIALTNGVKRIGAFFNAIDPVAEGRIHFPKLAQNIAQNRKGKAAMVIVIGLPLFEDEGGDRIYSMSGGFCPTDGHFTSDNNLSVFSTKGRERALEHTVFHWATLSDQTYADSGHRAAVTRFWTAFVQEQSGVIASFQNAPSVAFAKAMKGEKSPIATVTIDRSARRGRVRVQKVEVPTVTEGTGDADIKHAGDEARTAAPQSGDTVQQVTDVAEIARSKATKLNAAPKDTAGNPIGGEFDLAADGTQSGVILILQLHSESDFDFAAPKAALEAKGFTVDRVGPTVPVAKVFSEKVAAASQVWIYSSKEGRLPPGHIRILEEAWRTRKLPLMIAADNEPYVAEARTLLRDLFGASVAGNYRGMNVVGLLGEGRTAGGFAQHEVMSGVLRLYEGNTTSGLRNGDVFTPVLYGSEGHVLVAAYDKDGRRALFDGGFTRVFNSHFRVTAGTERMVRNVACWLAPASVNRVTQREVP
jgi:hypothetical protein